MDQGEDVEGAARKRDPLDFALWKGHKEAEDTSLGVALGPRAARAGTSSARRWPRSCSASGFEIHGGGSDLIFPHHENEAAQTRAARDQDLTRLWIHVGMVRLDAEKMSKSIGNVFMLGEALERHGPETLLMYFAGAHYHQPMEYDEDRLEEAPRAGGRDPQHGPRARRRSQPGVVGAAARSGSSTRSPTTSTRPGPWPRWPSGGGRPIAASAGTVGGDDLREMLDVLGLASLLESRRAAHLRRGRGAARRPRARARGARLGRGRPPARRAAGASAGRSATAPTGPSSCRPPAEPR